MKSISKKETQKILQSSLFWDTDIHHIDTDGNARFIIERVVTRGTIKDWKNILAFYGNDRVREEVLSIRSLDPKSLAYLSVYFNVEETKFRCYN